MNKHYKLYGVARPIPFINTDKERKLEEKKKTKPNNCDCTIILFFVPLFSSSCAPRLETAQRRTLALESAQRSMEREISTAEASSQSLLEHETTNQV